MIDPLNAVLAAREDLGPGLAVLRVRPEHGEVARFDPGQFVQLGLPMDAAETAALPPRPGRVRMHKRSYSIASAPSERRAVELYVARVPDGRFTPRLWALRPGDRLWLDPEARGAFTLGRVPPGADLVLVATGTGLAPYVSMLRHDLGSARWRRAAVLHGVRRPADLGYRAELEARAARDARVRYLPVVSRPEPDDAWSGLTGRVQVALEPARLRAAGIELDPARTHVFLCGNPDMIRDVRALLGPAGFGTGTEEAPGSLHVETYW